MKKITLLAFSIFILTLAFTQNTYAQTCGNGLTYTSSYPWNATHGTLSTPQGTKNNDWTRLEHLTRTCPGKLIFDEAEYYIDDTLVVFSDRIFEGTGKGLNKSSPIIPSSKIIQMADKPIFKIGKLVYDVAIRDMALIAGIDNTYESGGQTYTRNNLIGILAENNTLQNSTSLGFQFSHLSFEGFTKGIYVNATDPESIPGVPSSAHQWQFDNIRLDHAFFNLNLIGIHINSYNSGWNISAIDFNIPVGSEQGTSTSIVGKTYGIYLERSTYSSIDHLIGNGPTSAGPDYATALVYVKEHGNLSIQSSVAEGFYDDFIIHGNTTNSPINLMNNTILNGIRVSHATVVSSGNQFATSPTYQATAEATNNAEIYSFGDKFCHEGETNCDPGRGYSTASGAQIINMVSEAKVTASVPNFINSYLDVSRDSYSGSDAPIIRSYAPNYSIAPLFTLQVRSFKYDFSRNETDGKLEILGSQNNYAGYNFRMSRDTTGDGNTDTISSVKINNDGSVTYGSLLFTQLNGAAANGTVVYCSDCQQTATCAGSGTGAMAKRIAGAWQCN